jgi:hypothetical protein
LTISISGAKYSANFNQQLPSNGWFLVLFDAGRENCPVPRMSIARAALLTFALSGCFGAQTLAGQPHMAENPEAFVGRVVGDGHCVKFVQAAAAVPITSEWRPGAWVRGNNSIPPGTAIATFEPDGKYISKKGNHAAIYISQDETGIRVYDQWVGQRVHERVIKFKGGQGAGSGYKSNDGTLYRVVLSGPVTEEVADNKPE